MIYGTHLTPEESRLGLDEKVEALSKAIAQIDNNQPQIGALADNDDMDAWLLSYLDTITVILAIFAFMVSIMEIPQPRRAEIVTAIRHSMQFPTLTEMPVIRIETDATAKLPGADGLLRTIKDNGLEKAVAITITDNQATMLIGESLLFAPGDDVLSPRGIDVLRSLGAALNNMSGRITVEGHTDNMPIDTARFRSNWDLSAARGISVVRLLTAHGIPHARFRVTAYADTVPIADNATPEGRATNRRVSIAVDLGETQAGAARGDRRP